MGGDLRIRFHLGTSKAPTECVKPGLPAWGSHASGRGLKLSRRSRLEGEGLLEMFEKVSREETRLRDMARWQVLFPRQCRQQDEM